ncbi:hypothetical protein [Bordetella genomosp. 4]|uniref:Cell envelope biogenesis protein TolA n=1 Tax=Bordetella genomosp. 4 TaxID=463044 RepID=A0A261U6S6_9BORD|nr:hypothetical protein [Bordetella genomosp. 4]OZI57634.1 hypothetical protein CAL20_09670 [Bordetella genomosp. 4]
MSEVTELIELPPKETALQVFTDTSKLDEILDKVREKVTGTVYDMSKRKDREACASDAYKVARSKAAMEKLRAAVSADLKELPKKVDAGGRYLKEGLEAIQSAVRAPLDEWEKAEESRLARHNQNVMHLNQYAANASHQLEASALKDMLAAVDAVVIDESWEEFEAEAHRAKDKALTALRAALAARQQYEAEQAELARLRAEAEERRKKDEQERIAREAAERATREAEAKAQAERDAAAKREADAKAAQERAEHEAAEAVERQKQAEARAEAERLAAEKRAADAAEAARLAEIKRQADAKAAEEAEAKRREADKQHRATINRAALEAFVANGMTEECGKKAIILIASGLIPAIKINY